MNRLNICVKMLASLSFIACSLTTQALGQSGSAAPVTDVIIVYATGNVHTGPGKVDATSTPTPANENMKTVAGKLVSALTAKKISAKAVLASDVKNPDEMMKSKLIVLGSPAYFSNVSWQFKKFVDEQFMLIWRQNNRLNNHKVAAFCMAAEESSAEKVIENLKDLVINARGTWGPTMTVLGKNSPDQVKEEVDTFADALEAFIK
ncbi:MAG: hypothetical protein WCU00_11495 [Candidatus Latescibacterota bacterium]